MMFQFKQFSISQDKSAMKVGTDGVLLGAWTPLKTKDHYVLDIGTGTGLIALMLAQRNPKAIIDAIEIESNAFTEAKLNFENSIWTDRLNAFNVNLKSFDTHHKYDLIVSNPPYFTDTFKEKATKRTLARHVDNLSFKELIEHVIRLLKKEGACAFIVPCSQETDFISLAQEQGLYPQKITRVKGRKSVLVKRSLLYFTKTEVECVEDEIVIEIDRHIYTQDYINLTKSFYLKM